MTLTKSTATLSVLVVLALVLVPSLVLAQGPNADFNQPPSNANIQDIGGVYNLLSDIFQVLYTLFFAVAAFFILYGGFLYMTAAGDTDKVDTAKKVLLYAVIAIVIALLSLAVDNIVASIVR